MDRLLERSRVAFISNIGESKGSVRCRPAITAVATGASRNGSDHADLRDRATYRQKEQQ
jgi:hypothetical protein